MFPISDLTRTFGRNTAVDGVGFALDRPAMAGIIGASGAGTLQWQRLGAFPQPRPVLLIHGRRRND